jgi:Zn-finger nucleic acid-binding protein
MNCPKDGTSMVEKDAGGVLLDFCPHCSGIWMDWGELSRLAGVTANEHELMFRGKTDLPCPRCGKKMNLSDLHCATVEDCKCGIFFDSGEAEKVVGRELESKKACNTERIEVTSADIVKLIEKGAVKVGSAEIVLKR